MAGPAEPAKAAVAVPVELVPAVSVLEVSISGAPAFARAGIAAPVVVVAPGAAGTPVVSAVSRGLWLAAASAFRWAEATPGPRQRAGWSRRTGCWVAPRGPALWWPGSASDRRAYRWDAHRCAALPCPPPMRWVRRQTVRPALRRTACPQSVARLAKSPSAMLVHRSCPWPPAPCWACRAGLHHWRGSGPVVDLLPGVLPVSPGRRRAAAHCWRPGPCPYRSRWR